MSAVRSTGKQQGVDAGRKVKVPWEMMLFTGCAILQDVKTQPGKRALQEPSLGPDGPLVPGWSKVGSGGRQSQTVNWAPQTVVRPQSRL